MATQAVQLPRIQEFSMTGLKQASISKKNDEKVARANSMKYYTTHIRKINEFHVKKLRQKKADFVEQQPEKTQWQKYKTYMNLIEEDDGTFPRVSELSLRFEADRLVEESKRRLEIGEVADRNSRL